MELEIVDKNATSLESISYIEEDSFNNLKIYDPYINKGRLKVLGTLMAATICTIVPNTIDAKQLTPYDASIDDLVTLENSIEIEPDYLLLQELHTNISSNSSSSSLLEANLNLDEKAGDFDTEVILPIKRTFTIKAKVKSISKFIPKPFLD